MWNLITLNKGVVSCITFKNEENAKKVALELSKFKLDYIVVVQQ